MLLLILEKRYVNIKKNNMHLQGELQGMIVFNLAPCIGTKIDYIKEVVASHRIC
jgi:hypothetical protein